MINLSRRDFLKIAGTGAAASVLTCSCASRPSTAPNSTAIPAGPEVQKHTDTATVFFPDRVAYICGCKPDEHNPGGGGDSVLFIGNYCKNSERFLIRWNLSGLPSKPRATKAVMGLYCVELHGTPSGRLVYAPLKSDWGETVTYNTQPDYEANNQVRMEWPAKGHWHEVDITELVTQWLAAPERNHGLIGYAVDLTAETCSAVFASTKMPEEQRPRMTITLSK